MRRMPDNEGVREVRDNKPRSRHRERVRHRIEEILPDDIPMEGTRLQALGTNAVPAEEPEPVQQNDRAENHPQEEQREHEKQDNRIAVIPPNLGLDADVLHKDV